MFAKEELNALIIIVSASTGFTGKDARFIADLLDKMKALHSAPEQPDAPPAPTAE
jgi:hypothetical protein